MYDLHNTQYPCLGVSAGLLLVVYPPVYTTNQLRFGMSVLCLSPQQVAQSLAYILLVCHEIVIYVYINGSPMIPLKTSVRKIGGNCSIGNRSFFSSRQNQLLPLKQYNYFTGVTLIKLLAVALEIEFWCHLMRFFFQIHITYSADFFI